MADLFQNKYRVPTARASWHDYFGGMYHVTICTHNRIHHFGEVIHGEMAYTPLGEYAVSVIQQVSSHFPDAEAPLFVVMPNHIHIIISIGGKYEGSKDDLNRENLLARVVGSMKSAITKYARENGFASFRWQERFYDDIITSEKQLNYVGNYISNNVAKWYADEYNAERDSSPKW